MAGLDGTLLDSELIYQGNKEKFPTQDQPKQFLIYANVFPVFNWRLIDKIVGQLVPLTEENNYNFARVSPTELSFLNFFSSTNWKEQPEFCKVFPHWDPFFFGFLGLQYRFATRLWWKLSYKVFRIEYGYYPLIDIYNYPPLIQLKDFLRGIQHCVTVFGQCIFDIRFPFALPITQYKLE